MVIDLIKKKYGDSLDIDKVDHLAGLKQKNRPICGIYAFLNGFYIETKSKQKKEWNNLANKMWEESLMNLNNIPENIDADSINNYSLVGEFYDSYNLKNFLNSAKSKLWKNILKVMSDNGMSLIWYHVDYVSKDSSWTFLKDDLQHQSNNEGAFYIVPINSGSLYCRKDRNNMHWICIKMGKDNLEIINSANKDGERRARRHADLCGWKSISNIHELEAIRKNMDDREKKDDKFDFEEWANGHKLKKEDPCSFKKRITQIKKQECEYSFKSSHFDILKVTYGYKN